MQRECSADAEKLVASTCAGILPLATRVSHIALGKELSLALLDEDTIDQEKLLSVSNCDLAADLKQEWKKLNAAKQSLLDLVSKLAPAYDGGVEAVDKFWTSNKGSLDLANDTVCNFIAIQGVFGQLKPSDTREGIVKGALQRIEVVGGNLHPKLSLALSQL